MNSSSKVARCEWQEWSKLPPENEVLWYQEGVGSPKCLMVVGSLAWESLEQLDHVDEKRMLYASIKRHWWNLLTGVPGFCRTVLKGPTAVIALLQPMPTRMPRERVDIGIMGSPPFTKRENRYILFVTACFSEAAKAESMKLQDAKVVNLVFVSRWTYQHDVNERLYSD